MNNSPFEELMNERKRQIETLEKSVVDEIGSKQQELLQKSDVFYAFESNARNDARTFKKKGDWLKGKI